MKLHRVLAAVLGLAVYVFACPYFVEIFSDPKDVPDQEGEFVEIRLGEADLDSLRVQLDEKSPLLFVRPRGNRLVLVHDSLYCPQKKGVTCGLLGPLSLPNSRESLWRLQSGACRDSVVLPVPKAGKSLQRVKETDRWEFTAPSMGEANPAFEVGVYDCGLSPVEGRAFVSAAGDSLWRWDLFLTGCDSARLDFWAMDLARGTVFRDSVVMSNRYSFASINPSVWIRAKISEDEAESNNFVDTLISSYENSPLVMTEIHHCPQEPEPEWVEIYNRSPVTLPLEKFRFCNRGYGWQGDSLLPYETLLLSKDTSALREVLGFKDARLGQVALGYLNNTAGCLSVCSGETVIDSVCWDRKTVTCPAGFNPLTMSAENTPGFVRSGGMPNGLSDGLSGETLGGLRGQAPSKTKDLQTPFTYKLSSRVLRLNGNPLRVYVEGDCEVTLRLLDSAGRELHRVLAPANSNVWWNLPLQGASLGVAYVSLSAGKFENVVGVLIRP